MTIEEAFGLTLQELRKGRKITQEKLGFESGYHRTYISQLERGQKSPSLKTIFQLAAALKTSPAEIVSRVQSALVGARQAPRRSGYQTDEDNPY